MNRNFYTLIFTMFACLAFSNVQAQDRYTDEIFSEVQVQKDVKYGSNISILTGTPGAIDLLADVYSPVGDNLTDRPVVLVAHTGSFLPPILNQTTSGDRGDSTLVEICNRLAKRGFVAVAYTYRLGWVPTSPDPDVRQGSLLQAAYRAIQDTRTAVRYMKRSVAEESNPFGIDPNKIAIWGIGTGGYLAAGAATLDDYEEVILDKFLDANLNPLADTLLLGNFYGTTQAPLCLPNHPGYSSDFHLAINMGGAMGDLSWLDGGEEPPMVGVHCPTDIFAPYFIGNVVVPTTGELVIEEAAGTRGFIGEANRLGVNDIFASLTPDQDPLQARIQAQKMAQFMTPGGNVDLGTDNLYAFFRPFPEGSPWDWWDDNIIRLKVAFLNMNGFMLDADAILASSYATNSDMSAEKARRYIDTVFQLVTPRICVALDLGCKLGTNVTELAPDQTGLTVGPIPARDLVEIRTSGNYPMQSILVYDMNGRLVQGHTDLDTEYFRMDPTPLVPGNYVLRIQFENGFSNVRIVIQ